MELAGCCPQQDKRSLPHKSERSRTGEAAHTGAGAGAWMVSTESVPGDRATKRSRVLGDTSCAHPAPGDNTIPISWVLKRLRFRSEAMERPCATFACSFSHNPGGGGHKGSHTHLVC